MNRNTAAGTLAKALERLMPRSGRGHSSLDWRADRDGPAFLATRVGQPAAAGGAGWQHRRRTEKFVGVCVIVTGSAHGLVTQEHFQEWWGYGVFFLAAAVCLIGFGLALITEAIDPRYMPGDIRRVRRLVYACGALGNLSLVVLYVLTRTVGIPLGPGAGTVETVGALDVIAKASELLAVLGLTVLWVKTRPRVSS